MSQNYDVIHFEALGEEANHLAEDTKAAQAKGELPADLRYLIVPDTLQDWLAQHPDEVLPPLLTIKTHSRPPKEWLEGEKKSIITRSAGYDHLEALADVANITSLRNYCVNAVAQTAIKFMYCTAGLLNQYTVNTATFERNKTNSFMELDAHRVVTVFGVGKIGKRTYDLCVANGLTVQAVDVREKELAKTYGGTVNFVSKEDAIKNSDIIINTMNLTRIEDSAFYNVGYFSYDYLKQAKPGLVFINVTRGEIAPEAGLLKLYKEGVIGGIGVDVFSNEAMFSNALREGISAENADVTAGLVMLQMAESHTANIYVQPHQGFNSDLAAATKAADAVAHMVEWYRNGGKCFDEQLPYYGKSI